MDAIIEASFILGMATIIAVEGVILATCAPTRTDRDKWIPVEKQMPKDRERVLTYTPEQYEPIGIHSLHHYTDVDWWEGAHYFAVDDGNVTHWQPLPTPPR